MNGSKLYFIPLLVTFVLGCAVNGKHLYTEDGQCISCWNNPLTGKPINHEESTFKLPESSTYTSNLSIDTSNTKPSGAVLASADQLLLLYHSYTQSPLPEPDSVARELAKGKGELSSLAGKYKKERNAFNKKDFEKKMIEKANEAINKVNHQRVIYQNIYLSEYDFDKELYFICFTKGCRSDEGSPKQKFGAVKYGLKYSNLHNKMPLRIKADKARELERLAAKGTGFNYRSIPVLIEVRAASFNENKKWSDGDLYRELHVGASRISLLENSQRSNFIDLGAVKPVATMKLN